MSFSLTPGTIREPIVQNLKMKVQTSLKSISAPISSALTTTMSIWDNSSIQTEINMLEKMYSFVDYSIVSSFLKKNSFIIPLLFEAYGEIESIFSSNTNLSLKVNQDEADEKLYILIDSSRSDAYQLLDDLDDSWWIDALPRAKSKMNIDLEY